MSDGTVDFSDHRTLTGAVMIMLSSEGLRIPGLDTVAGQVKHGPVPLDLAGLLLVAELSRDARPLDEPLRTVAAWTGTDTATLSEVVSKLEERRLLATSRRPHAPTVPVHPKGVSTRPPVGMPTPS